MAVKKAAEDKAAEKKPAAKKPVAEKAAEKKPAAKKPAAEKAAEKKPAAKKPAAKKPAAKKAAEVIIQSPLGGEITSAEILDRVGKVDKVYVRVDQNKAYWVNGEETGSVDLW
jgi:membrane protein involved in colicin uptake